MVGLLTIVIGVLLVGGTGLALTGKGRYLIKGMTNLFFVDVAKTPKGAEAIYTQAIEEANKAYVKASNNFQKIAGLLDTAMRNHKNAVENVGLTKKKMEMLASKGQFDKVEILAEELTNVEEDVKIYLAEIAKYKPMYSQAETLSQNYETKLRQLQKDKKTVIRQLEINQQTKEMYDDLDELKNVKTSDKLLSAVKEGVVETGEMATGARTLHESKHSTKMLEIDKQVKSAKQSDYVEELRRKYNKK